jgi:acetyl-CoA carboxylase carboxyltransferase component
VIDPADARVKLVEGLRVLRTKCDETPQRKHGNIPL